MFKWLEPWWPIPEENAGLAGVWEQELQAEVRADHPLFGLPVAAIGKHLTNDDVVFRVLDGSGRVAVVHLTWALHPEPAPWPHTELYSGLDDFVARRMVPDHDGLRDPVD